MRVIKDSSNSTMDCFRCRTKLGQIDILGFVECGSAQEQMSTIFKEGLIRHRSSYVRLEEMTMAIDESGADNFSSCIDDLCIWSGGNERCNI